MYGTVARMHIKPGAEAQFIEVSRGFEGLHVPGFVGQTMYRMNADPTEFILAVVFTDKAAYDANAATPEQHARYLQYRELLAADPEWHDGEVVYHR
jgi:quinol monooxygenase YgiN